MTEDYVITPFIRLLKELVGVGINWGDECELPRLLAFLSVTGMFQFLSECPDVHVKVAVENSRAADHGAGDGPRETTRNDVLA